MKLNNVPSVMKSADQLRDPRQITPENETVLWVSATTFDHIGHIGFADGMVMRTPVTVFHAYRRRRISSAWKKNRAASAVPFATTPLIEAPSVVDVEFRRPSVAESSFESPGNVADACLAPGGLST
jgi:hypothetical protein